MWCWLGCSCRTVELADKLAGSFVVELVVCTVGLKPDTVADLHGWRFHCKIQQTPTGIPVPLKRM